METGNNNRCMTETTHVLQRKLIIKSLAFPKHVGPPILSTGGIDYFGTSEHYWVAEKKKKNRQVL